MTMKAAAMFLLLLVCVLSVPSPLSAQDVAGHYVLQGVMEVGSELMLKPDGTFEYMLAYGAADYWAKGSWRKDGDAVILHSSGKEGPPFRLLRSEAGKPGRIRVWVLGQNGKGVANIHVGLEAGDQKLEATTDSDGAAVFPDAPNAHAVNFEVRVYSLKAGPFVIDPANKDFFFEINGETITQVFFKDERLAIDKEGLVMLHWDPDKPMRYVKE
jgi:hypothetical protein